MRYRSKWEVEAAKLFNRLGVVFEYERFDKETKTRPDFWIPSIGRYLEIHPDIYGQKKPVKDCIIVKSKEHALASIIAIGLFTNQERTKDVLATMKKQTIKAAERWVLDLAVYLRQAIYERDGK